MRLTRVKPGELLGVNDRLICRDMRTSKIAWRDKVSRVTSHYAYITVPNGRVVFRRRVRDNGEVSRVPAPRWPMSYIYAYREVSDLSTSEG